jgi:hypothetical protein
MDATDTPAPSAPVSITCPECGKTSHHPQDIEQGYCGNCHWWTSDPELGPPTRNERLAAKHTLSMLDTTIQNLFLAAEGAAKLAAGPNTDYYRGAQHAYEASARLLQERRHQILSSKNPNGAG